MRSSPLREVSAPVSSDVETQRGKGVRDATKVALGPVCQRGVCDAVATRLYLLFCAMSDGSLKGTNGGTRSDHLEGSRRQVCGHWTEQFVSVNGWGRIKVCAMPKLACAGAGRC